MRHDFTLYWKAPNGVPSQTGVEIYDAPAPGGKAIIILTETNIGMSVTNGIETIATELHRQYPALVPTTGVIWIEFYPSEKRGGDAATWDFVELTWDAPRREFTGPKWTSARPEDIRKLLPC